MAQLFPKWTNFVPVLLLFGATFGGLGTVAFVWYYGSPRFIEVGYRPYQPVPYSHELHVGQLGMDCRYCHVSVETSQEANIPPTATCMNCHSIVKPNSEKLQLVRDSYETGKPIEWVRVHKLPEYAYFNHSVHIRAGVGCVSCHGNVAEMGEHGVQVVEPLSMSWCLSCHRNPEPHLRPMDQITNLTWEKPANHAQMAAQIIKDKNLKPPQDCSACHR